MKSHSRFHLVSSEHLHGSQAVSSRGQPQTATAMLPRIKCSQQPAHRVTLDTKDSTNWLHIALGLHMQLHLDVAVPSAAWHRAAGAWVSSTGGHGACFPAVTRMLL